MSLSKREKNLGWITLIVIVLYIIYSKGDKLQNLARGIKNNNPMNLRLSDANWIGKVDGTDKSFETFSDATYGIRAGAKLLLNYQKKYGLSTVHDIINRFAPPSENNTNAYADHVAKELGVTIDTPINVKDNLFTLVSAIITHENGVNPYSDATIQNGIKLAIA